MSRLDPRSAKLAITFGCSTLEKTNAVLALDEAGLWVRLGAVPEAQEARFRRLLAEGTGGSRGSDVPDVEAWRYGVDQGVELGRGGMGRVIESRGVSLDRTVALKIALSQDAEAERLFLREARMLARLQHPNIPPIYELGRIESGELIYSMMRVAGPNLKDAWASETLEQRLASVPLLLDVARALDHAHGQGIVHRDVKPSNLVRTSTGAIYLVDWGLAVDIREPASSAVRGTSGFLSPEQTKGQPAAPADDLFALGATLWSLLSGKSPGSPADPALPPQPIPWDQLPPWVDPKLETPHQVLIRAQELASIAKKAVAPDSKDSIPLCASAHRRPAELGRWASGPGASIPGPSAVVALESGARRVADPGAQCDGRVDAGPGCRRRGSGRAEADGALAPGSRGGEPGHRHHRGRHRPREGALGDGRRAEGAGGAGSPEPHRGHHPRAHLPQPGEAHRQHAGVGDHRARVQRLLREHGEETTADAAELRHLAMANDDLGKIDERVGRSTEAAKAYTRCAKLFMKVVEAEHSSSKDKTGEDKSVVADAAANVGRCLVGAGDTQAEEGHLEDGQTAIQAAHEAMEKMRSSYDYPANRGIRLGLAYSGSRLAALSLDRGRPQAARVNLEEEQTNLAQLEGHQPGHDFLARIRKRQAVDHLYLGDVAVAEGDLNAALTEYEAARALDEARLPKAAVEARVSTDVSEDLHAARSRGAGAGEARGGRGRLPPSRGADERRRRARSRPHRVAHSRPTPKMAWGWRRASPRALRLASTSRRSWPWPSGFSALNPVDFRGLTVTARSLLRLGGGEDYGHALDALLTQSPDDFPARVDRLEWRAAVGDLDFVAREATALTAIPEASWASARIAAARTLAEGLESDRKRALQSSRARPWVLAPSL